MPDCSYHYHPNLPSLLHIRGAAGVKPAVHGTVLQVHRRFVRAVHHTLPRLLFVRTSKPAHGLGGQDYIYVTRQEIPIYFGGTSFGATI